MKKQWLKLGVLLTAAYAGSAAADELSLGVKAGMIEYDLVGTNSDPAFNGGAMVRYDFLDLDAATVSVEGELLTSVIDGEIGNLDASFDSLGAFASVRSRGEVYVVGRAGIANSEIAQLDDTEVAFGIGVGFNAMGLNWEAAYTAYEVQEVDVDFFSVGLLF